ncbi:MAG: hypothetical protein K0U98_06690 [Deltaproteobacteria bacterium]|nr:hypothetical protein [Deltaproteobacteria bacterium]
MRSSLHFLIFAVALTAAVGSDASSPTDYVPPKVVEESRQLVATGTGEDPQRLRNLVELFRSTPIYCSDLEDVFLPVFLTHSRSDLLEIMVGDRQGVLDILKFGEDSTWFVYQILTQKPLQEAVPAVVRLLLATQDWDSVLTNSTWKVYFAFVTDRAPYLELPLLTRITRETENADLAIFAVQRLAEIVEFDPEDVVAERLTKALLALRRFRGFPPTNRFDWREVDTYLATFDLWQSRTGIDLVVDEIRSLNSRPYATGLLLPRVAMPLTCGDQVRIDSYQANLAFVDWWLKHRHQVEWDAPHGRWVADRKWLQCGQALKEQRVIWDA